MDAHLPKPPREHLPPLSRAELKALFDELDPPNPPPCTHTFKEARAFLVRRSLPVEETLRWLLRNGAGCDCEVIYNTEAEWGEWAGRAPNDDTE